MSSYDQTLLGDAPRATRAQLQEGYNVDLLEQPPRRTSSVRKPPPQIPAQLPPTAPLTPAIPETVPGEKFASAPYIPQAPEPRTSFWRSRKGVITVVLIALIVIGAVVGGAVGGTVKKSSNNTTGTNNPGTSGSAPFTPISVSTSTSAAETQTGTQTGVGTGTETSQAIAGGTQPPFNTTSTSAPTQSVVTANKAIAS